MLIVMPLLLLLGLGLVMLVLDVWPEHIEQIDDTLAMLGADRDRIAEPQSISLQPPGFARAALGLVRRNHDRRLPGAKPAADFLVQGGQALAAIDQEQGNVGITNRGFGLLAHAARQRLRILVLVAGRIDHAEFQSDQACLALAPVASHSGAVVHQRHLLADEAVEQRRLSHIGTSNDRYGGKTGHSARLADKSASAKARGTTPIRVRNGTS